MKNSVRIRIGAVRDDVRFDFPNGDHSYFNRAAMKNETSGAERRALDTDFATAICDHVGIKDRRRDRRANKHKDRRRGE